MVEFVFSSIMLIMLVLMILVAFFAFDNFIMGGIFGRMLKRWVETKYESGCNGDCNQGRACDCVKK